MERVATPWLIRRFIDQEAEFSFVPWFGAFAGPEGAVPFAIPGAELAPHDASTTYTQRTGAKCAIADPAVDQIGRVVAAGVAHLLHRMPTLGSRPSS